jgi:hypothetical protein
MALPRLLPRHGRVDDTGAVAIVVAISSLLLFGTAALAVDLGNAFNRRRQSQGTADLAALAGAQDLDGTAVGAVKARVTAIDYLTRNLPLGGAMPSLGWDTNGDENDGEIQITQSDTRIRVVVPRRTVEFGIAAAIGHPRTTVTAEATAEIQSPASLMPFYVADGQAGYLCLKDTSNGAGGGAAMRAALLPAATPAFDAGQAPSGTAGSTVTFTGSGLKTITLMYFDGIPGTNVNAAANGKSVSVTVPAGTAGTTVLVKGRESTGGPDFNAGTFTYNAAPPPPAPAITSLTPASGPSTGGTSVVIAGSNLAPNPAVWFGTAGATVTASSATSVTATAPSGSGQVNVTVQVGTQTSNALPFTYTVDSCLGSTGNFGFLDIPRSNVPASNNNSPLEQNIIKGLDHGIQTFPVAQMPAVNTECLSGSTPIAGAILDKGNGVEGANCLLTQTGNKMSASTQAFLDGINNPSLNGRLYNPPAGHARGAIATRTSMDIDSFATYVSGGTVSSFLAGGTVTVDREIVQCPRFSFVPVLNVSGNPQNGYYPIKSFVGVFTEEFVTNGGGSQVSAIKAYVIPTSLLPAVLTNDEVGGTVKFVGSGPRVPVLIG